MALSNWRLLFPALVWLLTSAVHPPLTLAGPVLPQLKSATPLPPSILAPKLKPISAPRAGTSTALNLCPKPILSRLIRHTIAAGETLQGLAQQYNLIPATLMGMNPALRQGKAPVGTQIFIPPYNGILVKLPPGKHLKDVAATYRVRSDVLFEVNGCQSSPPVVFVPGVNWSPLAPADRAPATRNSISGDRLDHYPLPAIAPVIAGYGWRLNPATAEVEFHSGVDLAASAGSPVMVVADGTVAFAGDRPGFGNLIVVNHQEGQQTRYAYLAKLSVLTGQRVKRGDTLGTIGSRDLSSQPQLHFEVRSISNLGWVAQDPTVYLKAMKVFPPKLSNR